MFSISVPNFVTIGRHLTSFVTCATFNMLKAYTHIWIILASKVCLMLKYCDTYDPWEPIAIVIFRSMYSGEKCNVCKWHHASSVDIEPNNSMAYISKILFMGTSWAALSIKNIKTWASIEMTSRKNIKIFDFNGVNIHWHVAGRGICHLWLPCF